MLLLVFSVSSPLLSYFTLVLHTYRLSATYIVTWKRCYLPLNLVSLRVPPHLSCCRWPTALSLDYAYSHTPVLALSRSCLSLLSSTCLFSFFLHTQVTLYLHTLVIPMCLCHHFHVLTSLRPHVPGRFSYTKRAQSNVNVHCNRTCRTSPRSLNPLWSSTVAALALTLAQHCLLTTTSGRGACLGREEVHDCTEQSTVGSWYCRVFSGFVLAWIMLGTSVALGQKIKFCADDKYSTWFHYFGARKSNKNDLFYQKSCNWQGFFYLT